MRNSSMGPPREGSIRRPIAPWANALTKGLHLAPLRLYGVGHMVKDHSESERGNPLLPLHGLLFMIISKDFFLYMHHPTDRIAHTTVCVTPVVEHWLDPGERLTANLTVAILILALYKTHFLNLCDKIISEAKKREEKKGCLRQCCD